MVVGLCFLFEMSSRNPTQPAWSEGSCRRSNRSRSGDALFAIGILGATVMPHDLYLHSSIVQTRRYDESAEGKREAVRFAFLDSTMPCRSPSSSTPPSSLSRRRRFIGGHTQVAEIQDAYQLLSPLLGVSVASAVFALALSLGTGLDLDRDTRGSDRHGGVSRHQHAPWLRRLLTRRLPSCPRRLPRLSTARVARRACSS